jgi:hypothetical protein
MLLASVIHYHFSHIENKLWKTIDSLGTIALSVYGLKRGQDRPQTMEAIK